MKRQHPLAVWVIVRESNDLTVSDNAYVEQEDARKFVEALSPGGTWRQGNFFNGDVWIYSVGVDKPWYLTQLNLLSREEWEKPPLNDFEKVDRYNQGEIEAIDVIEDWGLDFNLGSVIKYICRRMHKDNEIDNLKKALAYLQRAINVREGRHEWGTPKK